MPEERFPAGAVPVAWRLDIGQLLPLLIKYHRLRAVRVEERFGGRDHGLHEAPVETAYRRTPVPVDLDLQQIVALDPARPGRADLRQDPTRQLEYRKSRIFDADLVTSAALVPSPGDRGRMAARDGFDLAEQTIEDVAPVGEHIEDQPAPRLLAVIPTWSLRRVELAVEHPPAKIQSHRQHTSKEIGFVELPQLDEPGQEQFVLHGAVLQPGVTGAPRQIQRIVERFGDRLFEIDVLARGEPRSGAARPPSGRARVEIDSDRRIGETGAAIGAPLEAALY